MSWLIFAFGFLSPPLIAAVAALWFASSVLTAAVAGALGGLAALSAIQFHDYYVTGTTRFHGGAWCIKGSHFSPWFVVLAFGTVPVLGGALAGLFAHVAPPYFGPLAAVFSYVVIYLPLQLLVKQTIGEHEEWVRLVMAMTGRGPGCGPAASPHTGKCMRMLNDYARELCQHPEQFADTVGEYEKLLVQMLIVRGFLFGLDADIVHDGVEHYRIKDDEKRRAWLERPLTPEVLEQVGPAYLHFVGAVHQVQDVVRHQEMERVAAEDIGAGG